MLQVTVGLLYSCVLEVIWKYRQAFSIQLSWGMVQLQLYQLIQLPDEQNLNQNYKNDVQCFIFVY